MRRWDGNSNKAAVQRAGEGQSTERVQLGIAPQSVQEQEEDRCCYSR